jgi:hypothetical protein
MSLTCESAMYEGMTLTSAAGTTSVLVLRQGVASHPPALGRKAMVPGRPMACGSIARRPRWFAGPVAGRRYVDLPTGLIVLCTRSGRGTLSYDGRPMLVVHTTPAPR